jgi:uncharacterized protein YjbJ (UPF0337 family)
MDKDRIKGKMEDVAGRVQRQAGEWTGDKEAQAEGTKHQVKGKVRNAVGRAKDAVRDAAKDVRRHDEPRPTEDVDANDDLDREKGAA